jgi:branched-chain amino acid transport system ATP-binding protein
MAELTGISAGYQGTMAVRDITLQVRAGEVLALVGPNGSGKTTLLNVISGLVPCARGVATVVGERVDNRHPWKQARRGVVHVPDDRALFPTLTVRENLAIGSRDGGRANVTFVTQMFPPLTDLLDRRAGLLSGGEQQMLALGRGIAMNPKLLLLDEMSLGLAPQLAKDLISRVRDLADQDMAVVIVEQHVQLALDIADHAAVISHGECVFNGRPEALLADPDLLLRCYMGEAVS